MKVLLQFAEADFLVSPETAKQEAILADRYVPVTPVQELPAPMLLGQESKVFEVHRQKHEPMTDQPKDLAQRITFHLTRSPANQKIVRG
jgi:hypothetical protein